MRVLFLDVDGVLNYRAIFGQGTPSPVCPTAFRRVREVVQATGAKIGLSSTWRRGTRGADRHLDKLERIGLFELTHDDWRTPYDLPARGDGPLADYPSRGDEIADWLSRHPEVAAYAIVDDDSDMLEEQRQFFVQTTFEDGMLDRHRDALIAILGRAEPKV
jgi:hypothetical protein